jgi:ribonuclease D
VPERIRKLKAWRDAHAAKLKLDPGLIANKQLLTAIAVRKPSATDEMETIAGVKHWQIKAFGKSITRTLETVR